MMTAAQTTRIIITADDRTGAGFNSAKRNLRSLASEAVVLGKQLGVIGVAGAAAAAAGVVAIVNSQRRVIDEQAKLAQRLDTTFTSLSNLGRAGELAGVSMDKIAQASGDLTRRLSQAALNGGPVADALERIGLSARQLQSIPLDERIASINRALVENADASFRAALAGQLFGEEGALLMTQLNPEVIAEAARQVEIFGLNLSDVDAAKVEMANDAMSTFGMLADGIGKQLTVELAPILKAIGDEFLRSAEEAGGLGVVVQNAVGKSVDGLAFVIDAIEGVQRTFQIAGRSIAVGALGAQSAFLRLADSIVTGPVSAVNDLINVMNRLPGVSIQTVGITRLGADIRQQIAVVEGAIREGITDIQDVALQPLSGEALRKAFGAAQEAGQLAAEAAVAGRAANRIAGAAAQEAASSAGRATQAVRAQVDTVQRQIDGLVRQAATFNLSSTEAKLYELAMDGASVSQLNQARSLLANIDSMKAMADETERLQALLSATPTAQLEALRGEMALLEQAFLRGTIGADQFVEAAQTRLGTLPETVKQAADQMTVFADQAARNMQDAFAEFLFDPFDGGIRGMVTNFVTALRKMASEMLASQLLNMLGGSLKGQSGFLGVLGTALTGIKPRADGGPVSGGSTYLVGERGPELFVPRQSGSIVPNDRMQAAAPAQQNIRIVNTIDPAFVGDYMASPSGERVILNVIKRNPSMMRSVVA